MSLRNRFRYTPIPTSDPDDTESRPVKAVDETPMTSLSYAPIYKLDNEAEIKNAKETATQLIKAIECKDDKTVNTILHSKHYSISTKTLENALYAAVTADNLEYVKSIFKHAKQTLLPSDTRYFTEHTVGNQHPHNKTILMCALELHQSNHTEIIKFLLTQGYVPGSHEDHCELYTAARYSTAEAYQALRNALEHHPDFNEDRIEGYYYLDEVLAVCAEARNRGVFDIVLKEFEKQAKYFTVGSLNITTTPEFMHPIQVVYQRSDFTECFSSLSKLFHIRFPYETIARNITYYLMPQYHYQNIGYFPSYSNDADKMKYFTAQTQRAFHAYVSALSDAPHLVTNKDIQTVENYYKNLHKFPEYQIYLMEDDKEREQDRYYQSLAGDLLYHSHKLETKVKALDYYKKAAPFFQNPKKIAELNKLKEKLKTSSVSSSAKIVISLPQKNPAVISKSTTPGRTRAFVTSKQDKTNNSSLTSVNVTEAPKHATMPLKLS